MVRLTTFLPWDVGDESNSKRWVPSHSRVCLLKFSILCYSMIYTQVEHKDIQHENLGMFQVVREVSVGAGSHMVPGPTSHSC